jgi:hypothetical protein
MLLARGMLTVLSGSGCGMHRGREVRGRVRSHIDYIVRRTIVTKLTQRQSHNMTTNTVTVTLLMIPHLLSTDL